MEAFLQRFPDSVNSKDGGSYTILHYAAFQDHLDITTLAMDQVRGMRGPGNDSARLVSSEDMPCLFFYCTHVAS